MATPKITIRKFEEEDLEQAGQVVQRSMLPSLGKLSPETAKKKLERNNSENFLIGRELVEYYLAQKDQKILGLIGLQDNEIRTFYVDPIHQGKGIGKLLYSKVVELAKNRGINELLVKSSVEAIAVYEHLGFKKIKKIWKVAEDGRSYFTMLMKQIL